VITVTAVAMTVANAAPSILSQPSWCDFDDGLLDITVVS